MCRAELFEPHSRFHLLCVHCESRHELRNGGHRNTGLSFAHQQLTAAKAAGRGAGESDLEVGARDIHDIPQRRDQGVGGERGGVDLACNIGGK